MPNRTITTLLHFYCTLQVDFILPQGVYYILTPVVSIFVRIGFNFFVPSQYLTYLGRIPSTSEIPAL